MAKSLRSKSKRAYRSAARKVLEPVYTKRLSEVTRDLYQRAGLSAADFQPTNATGSGVRHGGQEVITNFVPTPEPVKLNCVHGPLAQREQRSPTEAEVSAASTLVESERPLPKADERMQLERYAQRPAHLRSGSNSLRRERYRPKHKKKHRVQTKPVSKRHPRNKRSLWKQS
eukprot:ctg_428.g300